MSKHKLMSFLLGLYLGASGVPVAVHVMYIVFIILAFMAGFGIDEMVMK